MGEHLTLNISYSEADFHLTVKEDGAMRAQNQGMYKVGCPQTAH